MSFLVGSSQPFQIRLCCCAGKAIQEQQTLIDAEAKDKNEMKKQLDEQKKTMQQQQKQIDELKKLIEKVLNKK